MSILVKINSKPKVGKAVFAITNIDQGETVIKSQLVKTVPNRNKYSLELNGNHIIINEPGVFVNHSCEPNCTLIANELGAFDFVAIRPISIGEEITFDYESIESKIVAFSDCLCQSEQCRGQMNLNSIDGEF
jgi:SET domain-containing protein